MSTSNSVVSANHNIICKRGDSFERQFVFWQDAEKTIPLDISAYSFKSIVVRPNDKSKTVLEFTIGNGFTKTGSTLTMSKTATQMSQCEAGKYVFDIQQTNGTEVATIVHGSFKIEDDITTV